MAARRWDLDIGSDVKYEGRVYRVTGYLDLENILAEDRETGEKKRLIIANVEALEGEREAQTSHQSDIALVSDEDWQEAQRRFDIIKPLLETAESRTGAAVEARAKEYDVHRATLYRWIDRYTSWPNLLSLIPQAHSGGKGKSRLSDDVEAILASIIEDKYLTDQKIDFSATYEELELRCKRAKVQPPHLNTLRNRIASISPRTKMKHREGAKAASEKYGPITGSFPGADWPLAVVQIDHTPLDIIVVDERDRQPIGRPCLTMAIDVFSRIVVGFYVTLEKPSSLSVGLCLTHAILPKNRWLEERGITTPWPVWGLMNTIHMDNAGEFRGKMMERACEAYSLVLDFRPVSRPNFGGHIERLLGAFSKKIHVLPGSTFSNVREKGSYRAEAKAAMTMSELEKWLTIQIVEVYHQKVHSELLCSPLKKFEDGLFGNEDSPGRGLPQRVVDEERLRIDFLPCLERTVQRYGVQIDDIFYYSDALRHWIHAEEQKAGRAKRKFLVRRDPRDISLIYFYDPELETYLEIPYRNVCHPSITLWELNEVKRRLKEEGARHVDEEIIFEAYEKLRDIEENAIKETKRTRRNRQRRTDAEKAIAAQQGSKQSRMEQNVELMSERDDMPDVDFGSDSGIEPYFDISR